MNLLEDNLANKFLSESMDKGSNIVVTLDSEKNIQIDIAHTEVSSETKNEDDLETIAKQGYRKSALAALQKQQPSV